MKGITILVLCIYVSVLHTAVRGTAIVSTFGLSCESNQDCEGNKLALTATSLSDGASVILRSVSEGNVLLETQDWEIDVATGRIHLKDHPDLILAKESLLDKSLVLRKYSKADLFSTWKFVVEANGFWSFKQSTFLQGYITVVGTARGINVDVQIRGAPGDVHFYEYDPIPVYDYVIVGAGTGGAKLAKFMTDGANTPTVAVLEAGIRRDDDPNIQSPRQVRTVESSAIYNFPYYSDIIPGLGGQRLTAGVGKMWGGTSNHNGMLYDRGLRYDWNAYAKYGGGPDWTYDSVQPLYTQQENYTGRSSGFGHNGDIDITDSTTFPAPLANVIINATQTVYPGFTPVDSLNGEVTTGVATKFELTQKTLSSTLYIREGSSAAHLNPSVVDPQTGKGVNGRRLQIISHAFGSKLIFHRTIANKVIGVEYITGDQCKKILARKEVILSAGAFNSPALLMRSGVGNCTYLASLNISCTLHSPYVGKNLQDHTRVQMAVDFPLSATPYIAATVLPINTDGHLLEGRVVTASGPAYTDPTVSNVTQADTKFSLVFQLQSPNANIPLLFDTNWVQGTVPVRAPIVEFAGILLRPKCTGQVQITSPLPMEIPQIQHNYLCHPDDKNWARQMYRDMVQIVRSLHKYDAAYNAHFPTEEMVLNVTTFERILPAIATGYRHPTSSLKMGAFNDVDGGVVSPNMCVHGLTNVRVVDASVFPFVPSNNPQSAVYTLAGLASRFIKAGRSC